MELIDVHSHILHNIDDGSRSLDISVELLKLSFEQGVRKLILTPHFSCQSSVSIDKFIEKRTKRITELKAEIKRLGVEAPELYAGAEVSVTPEMHKIDGIEKLAIENTDYILVEMPYTIWYDWMYDSVYGLIAEKNLIPIVAHIERYFELGNNKGINDLSNLDLYFQINAESVINKISYKNIAKLINNNLVYFMGSDAHNFENRPPLMRQAADILRKKISDEFVHFLTVNSNLMLENKPIDSAEDVNIPKSNMSLWDKFVNGGSI